MGSGRDPAGVIRRKSAAGYDAVDVRVRLQGLSPSMEDAEEADLGTEMLGIGRHFEQRSGTGLKQEREQDLLILPD